jgi:hypothetical protein
MCFFLSRGSAFINPLEVVTEEEKQLFQKGEENKVRYCIKASLNQFNL